MSASTNIMTGVRDRRRSPTTGTAEELMKLREEKRHLFGVHSFHDNDLMLIKRYYVVEADHAQRCYNVGMYQECYNWAMSLLGGDDKDGPSDAIRARLHTMLATEEVESDAASRKLHAEQAIATWNLILERASLSRFPIDRAREEKEVAEELLDKATISLREDDIDLKIEEAMADVGILSPPGGRGSRR